MIKSCKNARLLPMRSSWPDGDAPACRPYPDSLIHGMQPAGNWYANCLNDVTQPDNWCMFSQMKISLFQSNKPTSGHSVKRCDHRSRHGQRIWTLCLAAAFILLLAYSASATTYYVDWSAGSDSANGTSTSTPWKDAPGMNGFTGSYTHAAGDRFIFKGGVTWPTNMAPWNLANSGSAGNNDYYGVDKTWYFGGAWSQPVFNGGHQYPIYPALIYGYFNVTGSHLTMDNLCVTNIGVAGTNQGNYVVAITDAHDLIFENMTMVPNSRIGFQITIGTLNTVGNYEFASNDISACSWGIGGGPGGGTVLTNFSIHDNIVHDFHSQLDNSVHGDGFYIFGDASPANDVDNFRIYNNRFYGDFTDQTGAASMSAFIWPSATQHGSCYVYNNAMTYTRTNSNGTASAISLSGAATGKFYCFNNSFYGDGNSLFDLEVSGMTNLMVLNNIMVGSHACFLVGPPLTLLQSDFNDWFGYSAAFAFNSDYASWLICGPIATMTVNQPGTGYTVGSVITSGNGNYGFGALATVTSTNVSGGVTGLSLTAGGLGYKANWPPYTTSISGTGNGDLTVNTTVTAAGYDAHSLTGNPLFTSVTDLHPQTNSAALGSGTNLTAFATAHGLTALLTDLDGNARPSSGGWTIGAYEVAGVQQPAAISVTPASQDFGTIAVSATADRTFTVQNTGGGTLTGSASATTLFSVVSGGFYNLTAGQSQIVTVRYSPTAAGTNNQDVIFSGGAGAGAALTGTAVAPPVVSAITQNGADVDTTASGLQIYAGSVVQYSGSATDPNGLPLTWQWLYTLNGGTETLVQSGTGAVANVSFNYTASTAGNAYVWKLRASNGYATTESSLSVGVEAAPAAAAGYTFQTASASITTPFVMTNGYFYQPFQTVVPTNGGEAVFTFTITNAGSYIIQALVNAPGDGANSFFVNVDAEPVAPTMIWDIPITSGFEQRIVSWRGDGTDVSNQFVPKVFTLSAGVHQLIIRGRETNTQLQSLAILYYLPPPWGMRAGPAGP